MALQETDGNNLWLKNPELAIKNRGTYKEGFRASTFDRMISRISLFVLSVSVGVALGSVAAVLLGSPVIVGFKPGVEVSVGIVVAFITAGALWGACHDLRVRDRS